MQEGTASFIQADKIAIVRKFKVPLRDLRILDPNLSSSNPSALLVRERALVINLEHIKCIIGTDRCSF